ncbi:MAG: hypothetical protein CL424_19275 [Acidimicrobiaceae bacterium]|nr:hypothetical protein [Acidimicrobiaceae bacterium]
MARSVVEGRHADPLVHLVVDADLGDLDPPERDDRLGSVGVGRRRDRLGLLRLVERRFPYDRGRGGRRRRGRRGRRPRGRRCGGRRGRRRHGGRRGRRCLGRAGGRRGSDRRRRLGGLGGRFATPTARAQQEHAGHAEREERSGRGRPGAHVDHHVRLPSASEVDCLTAAAAVLPDATHAGTPMPS